MRALAAGLLILCLSGCHGGPMGAAALGAGVSVLGTVNQDALSFLKVSRRPVATPPSGVTPAQAR